MRISALEIRVFQSRINGDLGRQLEISLSAGQNEKKAVSKFEKGRQRKTEGLKALEVLLYRKNGAEDPGRGQLLNTYLVRLVPPGTGSVVSIGGSRC